MKRYLAALTAALCLLILAACSRNAAHTAANGDDLPAVIPTEAASAETDAAFDEPSLRTEIEPSDSELVCVTDYIPDLYVELRYAGTDNFTGRRIYDFSDAWLRYGTVKKLHLVQSALREQGFSLKIWDAFRPGAAQFKLWEACPDARYVADPYSGHSTHSSGSTLDLTIVAQDGTPLPMPTDFDEFSLLADRDYGDVPAEAARSAQILEDAMTAAGFVPYAGEWWHFSDADAYPYEDLENLPFPLNRQTIFEPDCELFLPLLAAPDGGTEILLQIPADASFPVLGWADGFARIEWQGQQGYVPTASIKVRN